MSRRKRHKEDSGVPSSWLTTYSDMVTLLLCFFVLLFSFSTVDAEKWRQLVGSLQGNIGVLEGGHALPPSEETVRRFRYNPEDMRKIQMAKSILMMNL